MTSKVRHAHAGWLLQLCETYMKQTPAAHDAAPALSWWPQMARSAWCITAGVKASMFKVQNKIKTIISLQAAWCLGQLDAAYALDTQHYSGRSESLITGTEMQI